jgi:hypothetical protein
MVAKQMMVAPGARIEVRDAEWLVRRVDKTETKGQALHVVGMSELVKGKEAIFISDAEAKTLNKIKVLDSAETKLVMDESPGFCSSRLYMESLLRKHLPRTQAFTWGTRLPWTCSRSSWNRLPMPWNNPGNGFS